MIHINAVRLLLDPIDKTAQRPVVSIKFVKKGTGQIVSGNVVCTSTNWQRDMVTLKFIPSGEIRSIHAMQIIDFNGQEVFV